MAENGRPPLVGVIGGIGPLASAYFLDMVTRLTDAATDQDNLDIIMFSHCAIPDRTDFILGRSAANPGPVMADDARRLAAFGARFLAVPCNTATTFVDQVRAAVDIPVLDLVDLTAQRAAARWGAGARVGVLATAGTRAAGVYEAACARAGVEVTYPQEADQAAVMSVIYDGVKAGRPVPEEDLVAVARRLMSDGAAGVVLGCTELSVLGQDFALTGRAEYIDSMETLAIATIEKAGAQVRPGLCLRP